MRADVERLVASMMDEGTVAMPAEIYRSATSWTLVTSCDGRPRGLAAHRPLPLPARRLRVVQIMATYLHPSLRGGLFAPLLLHGSAFAAARGLAPGRTLYFCTRTRNPAAFAAARLFNDVYPRLDCAAANQRMSPIAGAIARAAYGARISLDPSTFVLRDSYPDGSQFLVPARRRLSPVLQQAFARIDYTRNESLFLLARVPFWRLLALFWFHRLRLLAGEASVLVR